MGSSRYKRKTVGNGNKFDNKFNIIFSLEYLVKEAKREGYKELCSILKNALNIALKREGKQELFLTDPANDEDAISVMNFLVLYYEASPEVRKKVLTAIERSELDEDGKVCHENKLK